MLMMTATIHCGSLTRPIWGPVTIDDPYWAIVDDIQWHYDNCWLVLIDVKLTQSVEAI